MIAKVLPSSELEQTNVAGKIPKKDWSPIRIFQGLRRFE